MIELDIRRYRDQAALLSAKLPRIFPEAPLGSWDLRTAIATDWGPAEIDVYRPFGSGGLRLPAYFNIHGGGYCIGFREPDDPFCRIIAERSGCVVVNVGYAIAPERKFPSPVEQTYCLIKRLREAPEEIGIDPGRIAVGGQSSGGGIAAAVAILSARRGDFALATQVLNFPYIDLATPPAGKDWGFAQAAERDELVNVFENYVAWYLSKDSDRDDILASPANARVEELAGLCPALFIVAGRDCLSEEADRYARLLMRAGVELRYRRFPESLHGFTHVLPAKPAREAWRLIWTHLGEAFGRSEN
jgi:acetyl esterase